MKFQFIEQHRGRWPLRWLCAVLEVSGGGFYAWLKRPDSQRAIVDAQLTTVIRRSFIDSHRVYGARRVRSDLRDWAIYVAYAAFID